MCFRVVGGKRLKINAPQTNSTLHDKHSGHTLNIFSDTTSDKCVAATLVCSPLESITLSRLSVYGPLPAENLGVLHVRFNDV